MINILSLLFSHKSLPFGPNFTIPIFSELDNNELVESVSQLTWETSYKLFTEVSSDNSKYMTVHQAKGLEWDKVIVSVEPGKFDEAASIENLYSNPTLTGESQVDEFTRLYYVACSRARNDLYIHLDNERFRSLIESSLTTYINKTKEDIDFEFIE